MSPLVPEVVNSRDRLESHSTSTLYDFSAIKPVLNAYISQRSLVNPQAQHLINPDDFLRSILFSGKSGANADQRRSYKREELMQLLIEKMQPWHRIEVEGKEPVMRQVSFILTSTMGRANAVMCY